jgi:acetyl-CoA carboxylase biotin carboxyl carrier protein
MASDAGGWGLASIRANMAGVVARVLVREGDRVAPGQEVVVIESMKMEIPVEADAGGTVTRVATSAGAFVNEGDLLLELGDS